MRLKPPGYECQEDKGSWMLAFDRIESGIKFGLALNENVQKRSDLCGDVDKKRLFKIGIHWGSFLSMGPHTITGHADYFGPIGEKYHCSSPRLIIVCPIDPTESGYFLCLLQSIELPEWLHSVSLVKFVSVFQWAMMRNPQILVQQWK